MAGGAEAGCDLDKGQAQCSIVRQGPVELNRVDADRGILCLLCTNESAIQATGLGHWQKLANGQARDKVGKLRGKGGVAGKVKDHIRVLGRHWLVACCKHVDIEAQAAIVHPQIANKVQQTHIYIVQENGILVIDLPVGVGIQLAQNVGDVGDPGQNLLAKRRHKAFSALRQIGQHKGRVADIKLAVAVGVSTLMSLVSASSHPTLLHGGNFLHVSLSSRSRDGRHRCGQGLGAH